MSGLPQACARVARSYETVSRQRVFERGGSDSGATSRPGAFVHAMATDGVAVAGGFFEPVRRNRGARYGFYR